MVYPVHLFQDSRYTLRIEWSDGKFDQYKLAFLQQRCPCRNCQISNRSVDPLVLADRIYTFGSSGLKIDFDSGCKQGIYTYDYLKKIASASL